MKIVKNEESGEIEKEGVEDGIENEENKEDNNIESEQTNLEDSNIKGENTETRENNTETEEEGSVDWKSKFDGLEEEFRKFKETLEKKNEDQNVRPQEQLTPGQKEAISEKFGGLPFEAVQNIAGLIREAIGGVKNELLGQFVDTSKDSSINKLSQIKEFSDIRSYSDGMNEFLKKVPIKFHSDQEVLKDAYWYAKGKGMKNTISKIANSNQKNKRIAMNSRPVSPSSSNSSSGKSFKLSKEEEAAYESFGKNTFSSKEEYAAYLEKKKQK